MITRDNFDDIVKSFSDKQVKKINNTSKEYIYISLFCTNNIASVKITCTNNYSKYIKLAERYGDALFLTEEIQDYISGKYCFKFC